MSAAMPRVVPVRVESVIQLAPSGVIMCVSSERGRLRVKPWQRCGLWVRLHDKSKQSSKYSARVIGGGRAPGKQFTTVEMVFLAVFSDDEDLEIRN